MATSTQRRRKAARRRAHALRLDRPDYRLRHSIFDEWPTLADRLIGDIRRSLSVMRSESFVKITDVGA